MSTVTAVPQADFMRQVTEALENMAGPEAVQRITRLHLAELAQAETRATAARDEATHAVADAKRQHYLVAGVLETAQRETVRAAHQFAQAAQAGRLLTEIGRLAADAAEEGEEWAEEVQRVLATPLPRAPWHPAILAFHPSDLYSTGHFAAEDGAVHQVHPFTGWALVLERPDRPAALVPVFLVDNEIRTAASLQEERGLQLASLA